MWSFLIEFMPYLDTMGLGSVSRRESQISYFSVYCSFGERGLFGADANDVFVSRCWLQSVSSRVAGIGLRRSPKLKLGAPLLRYARIGHERASAWGRWGIKALTLGADGTCGGFVRRSLVGNGVCLFLRALRGLVCGAPPS